MKRVTYSALKKINVDYNSLKQDCYGYWMDRRGTDEGQSAYYLYTILARITCSTVLDWDLKMIHELEELGFRRPKSARVAKRILRELLEAYEEVNV